MDQHFDLCIIGTGSGNSILDDRFDDYRCAIVGTHESGNGMPEFTVVMAFRLF